MRLSTHLAVSYLALAVSGITGAHADDADTSKDGAGATSKSSDTLEEIVITGQKRTESLQDSSVAATSLAGSKLAGKSVARVEDLQFAVPGLSVTSAGLTQNVNIRGIGLASGSPNAANGVATYFDGVFQPPIVTTSTFYDIQSVEVFRGPQGTFVGSNSTGGAIFINSSDPQLSKVEGYAEGELGSYNRRSMQGAVNIPVGEKFAIRGAGNYIKRDSYYTNTAGLNVPGALDEKDGRIGAYWEPSSNFNALLKLDWIDKSTDGYAYRPIKGTRYAPYRTDDIYTLNYSDDTRNDENAFQGTARLEYITDGGITLRSTSGYQNKRIRNYYDSDGTNTTQLPRSTQDQFVRERVWTEELNVLSPDSGNLTWIAGGYYQKNRIDVDISNITPGSPVRVDIDIQNRKVTTGFFGQATYRFTPNLSLDLGARYNTYDVTGTGAVTLVLPSASIFLADPGGAHKDKKLTGKVGLNWTPNDNTLVYGFIARGYKSGGYASTVAEFSPETVVDYELGWKTSLFDGHVNTQFGAFYYDYKNFQLDAINPTTGRSSLINLTNATLKGIEAQFQGKFGGFGIDGGLSYVDSSLSGTDFIDTRSVAVAYPGVSNAPQCPEGVASNPPACLDYSPFILTTSGGSNLYSPKWTYNIGAQYRFDIGDASITSRLNYAYVGSQYTYIAYNPTRDRIKGHGLLSAMITVDMDRYSLEFWGRNLTKERYVMGQSGNNEFYGAPREFGVRARVDF